MLFRGLLKMLQESGGQVSVQEIAFGQETGEAAQAGTVTFVVAFGRICVGGRSRSTSSRGAKLGVGELQGKQTQRYTLAEHFLFPAGANSVNQGQGNAPHKSSRTAYYEGEGKALSIGAL